MRYRWSVCCCHTVLHIERKCSRAPARSAVADAVPPSTWINRELADCVFKDERLGKHLRSLLEQLFASPDESIPLVCQDWANTQAAYRFLDNDRVSEAEILAGHFEATRGCVAKRRR